MMTGLRKGSTGHVGAVLATVLLCLVLAPDAHALDQKVGQHWRCIASDGGSDIEYAIGLLENVSDVIGDVPDTEDIRLAHLHVWEAHEYGVGQEVAHMPVQANRLSCSGQIYVGEGMELPARFTRAYEAWAAEAASGRAQWFLAPVDLVFTGIREVTKAPGMRDVTKGGE